MAMRWYVVHVYSGFEKKVSQAIREKAAQKGLEDKFEEILVPTEEVVEVRRGSKVNTERKFFPGYVLMKATLTDSVISLVKNTPRVTGFLGEDRATAKPVPYVGIQYAPIPEFQAIGTELGRAIAGAVAGQTTVDQALDNAQAAADRIMQEAGYY